MTRHPLAQRYPNPTPDGPLWRIRWQVAMVLIPSAYVPLEASQAMVCVPEMRARDSLRREGSRSVLKIRRRPQQICRRQ